MSDLSKEYSVGAAAVLRRLEEQRPEYLDALKSLTKSDVSYYRGAHDHVQNILGHLGIPASDARTKTSKIIFVNCGHSVAKSDGVAEAVKDGLHFVSSDWALDVVIGLFPGMLKKLPKHSADDVISVEANTGSVWDDVVIPGANPQWWLESASYAFDVLDSEKIRSEAASHDLLQKLGSPHVAVSFPWGAGSVFHVISHFWCKRSRHEVAKHKSDAVDFLREGMKISEEGIEALKKAHPELSKMTFGALQTAATSTELIAQLAARSNLK